MFDSFRHAMSWVHTWFGLVLGLVLMVVFFFGSLSVFDREIDRWAIPETRAAPQPLPSFDDTLGALFASIEPDPDELAAARERLGTPRAQLQVDNWSAYPTQRDPLLDLYAEFSIDAPHGADGYVHGRLSVDPRTGAALPATALKLGSEFFYPLHYSLRLNWLNIGSFIVGIAALVMLAALVSGVVIHRRLFREFFTLRPHTGGQRSTLDLHNLTGVIALPFHFMFPLTGLIIFSELYFPLSATVLAPLAEHEAQVMTARKGLAPTPAGLPAPLASVDAMVVEAKRRWAAHNMPGEVGYLHVEHVGDANSYVSIYRAGDDRVALIGQGVHFAGPTGQVLYEEPPPSLVTGASAFLTGLHMQHFRHWPLRWLYLLGGLCGCVCIGTGLVFFVNKRKRAHAGQGVTGARWIDALALTSITGMLLATLAILVANRALPAELTQRDAWQQRVFWCTWLGAFAHAVVRSAPVRRGRLAPAWREQCWTAAALGLCAPVLNWITTGDHLIRTLARADWPVAGLDLALITAAAAAATVAVRLRRRERDLLQVAADDVPVLRSSAEATHV